MGTQTTLKPEYVTEERIKEVNELFKRLLSTFHVCYIQNTKMRWTGDFHLEAFIGGLSNVKNESPLLYTFLLNNHKDFIDEVKKLGVKLKLQGLPLPSTFIDHSDYYCNPQKTTTQQDITIDSNSTWRYFFNLYDTNHWVTNMDNRSKVKGEEKRYLGIVTPLVRRLCKVVTAAIYYCLADVHENTST